MKELPIPNEDIYVTSTFKSILTYCTFLDDYKILLFYENGCYQIYSIGPIKLVFSGKIMHNSFKIQISSSKKLIFINAQMEKIYVTELFHYEKCIAISKLPTNSLTTEKILSILEFIN